MACKISIYQATSAIGLGMATMAASLGIIVLVAALVAIFHRKRHRRECALDVLRLVLAFLRRPGGDR
jgi:hypothetical protein